MAEENTPTKCYVRVALPENICLQCGGSIANTDLRRRLFSGSDNTKTGRNLELLLGDVLQDKYDKSAIICRNCSERNETLCKKIFSARENFHKTQEMMVASNLDSSIRVKRLTKPSDEREDLSEGVKKFSSKRRALFHASAIPEEVINDKPLLKKRDGSTQTDPKSTDTEVNLSTSSSVEVGTNFLSFTITPKCCFQLVYKTSRRKTLGDSIC